MRSIKNIAFRAAATIHSTETVIADANSVSEIDVRNYDKMLIWLDYTKGDETGVYFYPKFLALPSGDEHQFMEWSTAADAVRTAERFYLTASAKAYIVLDVEAVPIVKLYELKNGGTPTGTLQVSYTLLRKI